MSFFQRKSTYTDPEGRVVKKGIPKFIPVLIRSEERRVGKECRL